MSFYFTFFFFYWLFYLFIRLLWKTMYTKNDKNSMFQCNGVLQYKIQIPPHPALLFVDVALDAYVFYFVD